MTKLNSSKEEFIKKKRQALLKLSSFREDFEKKKEETEADLEEAGRILKELGERFRWWGRLP